MESRLRDKLIASFSSKEVLNLLRPAEKRVENRPNRVAARNSASQAGERKILGESATRETLSVIYSAYKKHRHSLSLSESIPGIESINTSRNNTLQSRKKLEAPDETTIENRFLRTFFPKTEQENEKLQAELTNIEEIDKLTSSSEIVNKGIKQLQSSFKNHKFLESNSMFGAINTQKKENRFNLKEKTTENILSTRETLSVKQLEEKTSDRDYHNLYQEQCALNADLRKQVEVMSRKINEMKDIYDNNEKSLQAKIEELSRCNLNLTRELEKLTINSTKIEVIQSKFNKDVNYETLNKEQLISSIINAKSSYSKVSKTLMKNADELYEQNLEYFLFRIKQLNYQKNEILKKLGFYKIQTEELSHLREHVSYLMNYIHDLKEELKKIAIKPENRPFDILNDLTAIVNKPVADLAFQINSSLAKLLLN